MNKLIAIIFIMIAVFTFKNIFSKNTYNFSALEIDKNITRQEYLGNGLGKIYKNRFGVYYFYYLYPRFMKFESIFFSNLSKSYIYIPLFGFLIYKGLAKKYEK